MVTERLRLTAERVAALLDAAEPDAESTTPEEQRLFAEAVAAVRAGGVELLDTATPHLWEYYRDVAQAVGDDNLGMVPLVDGADIWEHVELLRPPTLLTGFGLRCPSPCYVNFEGEVTWEPEHGLQLVFDHSGAVCRVGPYSGHLTVAGKFGDAFLGEIYG